MPMVVPTSAMCQSRKTQVSPCPRALGVGRRAERMGGPRPVRGSSHLRRLRLEHPAFLLDDDERAALAAVESMRAALGTGAGTGGYLIPLALSPTVQLANDGAANPFRSIARVEQTVASRTGCRRPPVLRRSGRSSRPKAATLRRRSRKLTWTCTPSPRSPTRPTRSCRTRRTTWKASWRGCSRMRATGSSPMLSPWVPGRVPPPGL